MHIQKLVVAAAAVLALVAFDGSTATAQSTAANPIAPQVGILHFNITKLDRSLAWYRDVLGMETVSDNGGPKPTTNVPGKSAMMHTHVLKTPGGEFSLELVEMSGVDQRPQKVNIQDPGAIMLALNVSDLDAVLAGARKLGLKVISTGGDAVTTTERGRQVMVRDDDGVTFYLSQAKPGAAKVQHDYTFMAVGDLDKTVAFYNGVFGLNMEKPGKPGTTSDRIVKLSGNPALSMFRMSPGKLFDSGVLRFQEFTGDKKTPVQHRVQDPGGPILTVTVKDFAGVMKLVEPLGGTIGDGNTSGPLAPGATVSWIRDPNGLLIRVSAAR
jgi:catechol 2,3-dioxygenase-like lactoylglutathione lyase family enzyme